MGKEIFKFIDGLQPHEIKLIELCFSMARDSREIMKEFSLSEEEFQNRMLLTPGQYRKFIKGSFDYTIKDLASLKALYCALAMERTKKESEKIGVQLVKSVNDGKQK